MTGAVYRCGGRLTPGGRCQQDLVGSVGRIDETLRSWIIRGMFLEPVQQGAECIGNRCDVSLGHGCSA
jgi:hypothetical protein